MTAHKRPNIVCRQNRLSILIVVDVITELVWIMLKVYTAELCYCQTYCFAYYIVLKIGTFSKCRCRFDIDFKSLSERHVEFGIKFIFHIVKSPHRIAGITLKNTLIALFF